MKKQIAVWLVVAMLMGSLSGCSTTPSSTENPSPESSASQSQTDPHQEDLHFVFDTLAKKHKNLFAKISKEEWQRRNEEIAAQCEGMTDGQFYYALKSLIASVGDAHTDIGLGEEKYDILQGLLFAVAEYEGDWRLLMAEKANATYLGWKVTAISGTPIEEVFERSRSIISAENDAWRKSQFSNTINFQEALEYLKVVKSGENAMISLEDDQGNTMELEMKPQTKQEIMGAELVSFQPEQFPVTAPLGIYRSQPLDDQNYFIQYNSCQEAPDLSMKDFTAMVEQALTEKTYPHVIFDLRYNTGGNSAVVNPLLKKLKQLQAEQGFQVYTLIGRNTFSSGIINAINTQDMLDATLVGVPTGGSVNGYGELKNFELPHAPMTVWYSTKYFNLVPGYDKDGLYPDQEIPQSFAAYAQGVDNEVSWVQAQP